MAETLTHDVVDRIRSAPDSRRILVAKRSRRGTIEYRRYTYAQLAQATRATCAGLRNEGIGKGTRTLVLVKPGFDFFTVILALGAVGAVPVLVDPGVGLAQMVSCIGAAGVSAMIAEPRAFLLKLLRPKQFSTVRTSISAGGWFPGAIRLARLRERDEEFEAAPRDPGEVCMIAFTSGSTGAPKGVEMTYGNVTASNALFADLGGDDEDGMDLIALPPLAMISIIHARSLVMPDIDFTALASARPEDLLHAIREHRVTTSFGSPVVYRNLARHCVERGISLPSLRRAFSAGAPISLDVIRDFAQIMAPGSELITPYGATEALPVTSIGGHEILRETAAATRQGAGTCVGRPLGDTQVKIIAATEGPIAAWDPALELAVGETGEIVVSGPQVTTSYFGLPRATELAKIVDERPDGTRVVWHRMGDIGRFDEAGRLWFCGRKAHVVVHDGRTFYPVCVEGIFNAEPDVFRCALVGYRGRAGPELALIVELVEGDRPKDPRRRRDELLQIARRHDVPLTRVIFHGKPLPTDRRHNSKIERTRLAEWAREKHG